MRTLYIDRRDARLDCESGALTVRTAADRPASFPLSLVERVVVHGNATLSGRLLAELWKRDCGLLVLSGRRLDPTARFLGRPRQDIATRLAQYEMVRDPARRLSWARRVVRAKLASERRLLARLATRTRQNGPRLRDALSRIEERLEAVGKAGDLAALTGIEGAAAAAYFRAFTGFFAPSLEFTGRNRRPPRDPVNVCLSLGYTLLQFEASRQLQMHGLDPMLGALHAPAAGRESLACDLVEPLRSRVDRLAFELFAEGILRRGHFHRAGEACQLGKEGRQRYYQAWERHAPAIARLLGRICGDLVRELRGQAPALLEIES